VEFYSVDVQRDGGSVSHHAQVRLRVTGQALLIGNLFIENPPDLVWLMTVDAYRNIVRLLFPQFAADDFSVDFLDPTMAFLAGGRDIIPVNARTLVGMGQDKVRGVAVGADGGDGQTPLVQAFAVHRKRVMGQDAVLGNVIRAIYRGAFLVAPSAHYRDVELGYARIGRGRRFDIMGSVAVPAARRQLGPDHNRLTVKTLIIKSRNIVVAW